MPKLRRLAGRDVLTILQGFGFQQVSHAAATSNWSVTAQRPTKS